MTRRYILMLLFLLACDTAPPGPVDPVWGKQPCSHCMMLISDRTPSAQLLGKDGARRFFDDVGCMAEWLEQNPTQDGARAWVRGADGHGWQGAATARFAGAQRTPMDYGFVPAAQGVDFTAVREAVRAKARQRAEAP
jgi:copper chaperone NosL